MIRGWASRESNGQASSSRKKIFLPVRCHFLKRSTLTHSHPTKTNPPKMQFITLAVAFAFFAGASSSPASMDPRAEKSDPLGVGGAPLATGSPQAQSSAQGPVPISTCAGGLQSPGFGQTGGMPWGNGQAAYGGGLPYGSFPPGQSQSTAYAQAQSSSFPSNGYPTQSTASAQSQLSGPGQTQATASAQVPGGFYSQGPNGFGAAGQFGQDGQNGFHDQDGNGFGAPGQFGQFEQSVQYGSQYGNQYGNQFGNQYGNQFGNQFGNQYGNQYGGSSQHFGNSNDFYGQGTNGFGQTSLLPYSHGYVYSSPGVGAGLGVGLGVGVGVGGSQ
ncbi:hypothetical protein PGT21_003653 [Puccinia graminis f. sp. tritici]|uniref:Uncharacterized protein n=2 Tax=Puccinia graminis f. sp. tritici TaxID=56615 RepID=A0A5B0PWT7_PUCGR|nr:hypothetical protein PGT21_003653 [Puccinia graminis f. sp. tritici]